METIPSPCCSRCRKASATCSLASYVSAGHGGWSDGDEFNQTINKIRVDGREVFSFIPWREDCSVFRPYNPASGNFWNGISSSDLSRSGWCPGGVADPHYVPLPQLKARTSTSWR
ncbi:MAG: peptide-N-glycosidase F-related protein [Bacteroidales bacterium]|nr:peptide-N-glycosidase F-related protein [Bacteroidales bacterium]